MLGDPRFGTRMWMAQTRHRHRMVWAQDVQQQPESRKLRPRRWKSGQRWTVTTRKVVLAAVVRMMKASGAANQSAISHTS